jgi:hypothetical protein
MDMMNNCMLHRGAHSKYRYTDHFDLQWNKENTENWTQEDIFHTGNEEDIIMI